MNKLNWELNKIILYKNPNLKTAEVVHNTHWSRKGNKNFSCMHAVAAYLGLFAPSLPAYFIQKYSLKNDWVCDHFSGRGTTGLVCRELERKFIGSDLNPYAIVLSRMKVEQYNQQDLFKQLTKLGAQFQFKQKVYQTKAQAQKYCDLRVFYSQKNLAQLIFLQEQLGKKWKTNSAINNAILGYACGLMHGPSKKSGETIYFSLDMPNTISMSVNYVRNYATKNQLIKPENNIFELIANRINARFDPLMETDFSGQIFYHNAIKPNRQILNEQIALVITSPPYLNVINYTLTNWLKLWLLGYERQKLKQGIRLSDNLKGEAYLSFIKKYLINIYPTLKKAGKVCLIVGDYHNQKMIETIWEKLAEQVPYEFVEIYYDQQYSQNYKATNMLNAKKGLCTKIEKVLVLEKK